MINWKACKLLDNETLDKTARAAVTGDRAAIETLVQSNIKLASSLAHQYRDFDGIHTEDLTSEAILGMIEAIPTFDPARGTKFTTYASWRMRARVLAYILENFRLVKIGTSQQQRKIFWRLNRDTEALRREGVEPTDQALAARLQVRVRDIQEMKVRMSASEASLTAANPSDPQGGTLLDTLDSGAVSPERYATRSRMAAWMRSRMVEYEQRLSPREMGVWNHRIASPQPLTLQETGDRIGTTRQYVQQTEQRLRAGFIKYARNKARD